MLKLTSICDPAPGVDLIVRSAPRFRARSRIIAGPIRSGDVEAHQLVRRRRQQIRTGGEQV